MSQLVLPLLLLLGASGLSEGSEASLPEFRGVCFVGGRHAFDEDAFLRLGSLNVTWISVSPFGWMRSINEPEVVTRTGGRIWWGESDEGLRATFGAARAQGIQTLLSPHIWLRPGEGGEWRGALAFATESDWLTWEKSYRKFILHYARLAAAEGVEAFCLGTELRTAVTERPEFWRSLIADVRSVYDGRLTYAANWYEEFEEVGFWDLLDFIGIQAYFPLREPGEAPPTVEELMAAWSVQAAGIEALHTRIGKPVVFAEVGYRSTADAAVEPWLWSSNAAADREVQAACYEAMFRTFWRKPWFGGTFVWKWYSYPERRPGGWERDFTPQGKPAEEVMARWYGERGR